MTVRKSGRESVKPGGTAGMLFHSCPSKIWDRSFFIFSPEK